MATDSGKKDDGGPRVVKGDQNFTLDREAFRARLLERFNDPGFETVSEHLEKVIDIAWDAYMGYRKSPRTRKAGPEFADPEYQLPMEWLETRRRIQEAQARHDDPKSPARILVINGSARSDQTCPGEISKTYRLAKIAREAIAAQKGCEVDFLDLSRLTGEFGLVIYPCKACVSTAQPLCHWPCTCYPNHALRQTGDWMHDREMIPPGPLAGIDRVVGTYEACAAGRDDVDKDVAVRDEVRKTALELVETGRQIRSGEYKRPHAGLEEPQKK